MASRFRRFFLPDDGPGSRLATLPLVAAAFVVVAVVFATTPLTRFNGGFDSDGLYYAAMTGKVPFPPAWAHRAPWCFRVVTPFLASLLPFDVLTSFRILAFGSSVLSLVLFARILEFFRLSSAACALGTLFYAGSFWVLRFPAHAPAYVDHQTQLLLLLVVFATLRRWYPILPVVFAVAALQKESLAAYALFSIAHLVRQPAIPRARAVTLSLAMLALPAAALLAVRSQVVANNAYSPLVLFSHFQAVALPGFWPVLLQAAFSGLGLIPVVLAIHPRAAVAFLARHREWLVFAAIGLVFLFGGADKARLMTYGLPLGALLVAVTLDALRERVDSARLALWLAAVVPLHLWIGNLLTPIGDYQRYLARMVPEYSEGRFLPFLTANLLASVVVVALGVPLLSGPPRSRPEDGPAER